MKKSIIITTTLLLCVLFSYSQDVITKINGDEIQCKVIEVGIAEIKYKTVETSPVYVIGKGDVFMIKYSDGKKDIFGKTDSKPVPETSNNPPLGDPVEMFKKGTMDAAKFYTGRNSGAGGTLATTLVFPLLGLIPAAVCSSNEPKDFNLNLPNIPERNNSNYLMGYKQQAHKIKRSKVWTFFGIGLGIDLLVTVAYISNTQRR